MTGADRPQQNIYVLRGSETPAADEHVLFNRIPGLYYYDGTALQRLAQANEAVNASYMGFSVAGSVADAIGLGAAWRDIDWYTNEVTPLGFVTDVGAGTFQFGTPGVFVLHFSISFSHNEISNAGRSTGVRVNNITKGVPGEGNGMFTGRNQDGTQFTANIALPISQDNVGDTFGMQIGGGDNYSSVVWQTTSLTVYSIGVRP